MHEAAIKGRIIYWHLEQSCRRIDPWRGVYCYGENCVNDSHVCHSSGAGLNYTQNDRHDLCVHKDLLLVELVECPIE